MIDVVLMFDKKQKRSEVACSGRNVKETISVDPEHGYTSFSTGFTKSNGLGHTGAEIVLGSTSRPNKILCIALLTVRTQIFLLNEAPCAESSYTYTSIRRHEHAISKKTTCIFDAVRKQDFWIR